MMEGCSISNLFEVALIIREVSKKFQGTSACLQNKNSSNYIAKVQQFIEVLPMLDDAIAMIYIYIYIYIHTNIVIAAN